MSIASLAPANSKKARVTAINSFTIFLAAENMTVDKAQELISDDKTGKVFRIILDKYAYFLARSTDKARSTNTCLAYFGNVKNWLLDKYPQQGAIVQPQLQKVLSGLGKFCSNREDGAFEKKAPPCSKQDLEIIVRLLYTSLSTDSIYLDASLVVMMWYLYGRSSDAEQLEKQQLSILPGGVLFLRFKRVKTALLQGVSLFKNPNCFLTCPLFTLAAAIAMKGAPSKRIFPQFVSTKRSSSNASDVEELSLVELLEADDNLEALLDVQQSSSKRAVPGLRIYAGHDPSRPAGGPSLELWSPKEGARLPSLHALDPLIRDRARALQALLFASSTAFDDISLNLDEAVLECLAATLLMHYPELLLLSEKSAIVRRMRDAMEAGSIGEAEALTWSATIRLAFTPTSKSTSPHEGNCKISEVLKSIKHQSEQIQLLILQNKRLEDRQLVLEAQLRTQLDIPVTTSDCQPETTATVPHVEQSVRPKKKGSQSLSSVWFEWFTAEPRVYASRTVKKTTLYEFRHITGYLMLFLPTGCALDAKSPAYKSEALRLGEEAQTNALAYLKAHEFTAIAAGTALKALRKLHKAGGLDAHIAAFHQRVEIGNIADPIPPSALPTFIHLQPTQ